MLPFRYVAVLALIAVCAAQDFDFDQPAPRRPAPPRVNPSYSGPTAPRPTPISILKQINRHNEDGSYTYGYEGSDGAFKIETKLPTGEVKGKYGYVDDTGKVRVVEYGATKYGFEPVGEGITVAPPTLVDETTDKGGNLLPEFAGQYYDQDQPAPRPAQTPIRVAQSRPAPQAQPQSFEFYSPPQQFEPAPRAPARKATHSPVPQRAQIPGGAQSDSQVFDFGPPSRPQPQPQRSYAPAPSYSPAPRPRPQPLPYARPAPIEEDPYEPAPSPVRTAPRITYAQPLPPSRPSQDSFGPPPRPKPQYAPRPAPSPVAGRSGGILDQLSKEYALPGNSAPLHDISFGYY